MRLDRPDLTIHTHYPLKLQSRMGTEDAKKGAGPGFCTCFCTMMYLVSASKLAQY